MPILAIHIPAFPLALLARANPAVLEQPWALLGPDERVLAASRPALACGVRPGQRAREARLSCPEARLCSADIAACRRAFEELLCLLDDYSDRVEPIRPGAAYLDASHLAEAEATPFCQEIGRRVRREMGQTLQPAIGCDRSKFTARAASMLTRTGAVRVVPAAAEKPFLRPLPVTMVPLPSEDVQLLLHLGVRTLGQFADLPARAVFAQFGAAGKLARQWARGQDNRPVRARRARPTITLETPFEPPLTALSPLLLAAERLLKPVLQRLRHRLEAAQTLEAVLQWERGGEQRDAWTLPAAATDPTRWLRLLETRWAETRWPDAVIGLRLVLSDIQEADAEQWTLFPGAGAAGDYLAEFLAELRVKYDAARFLRGMVRDPLALRVERRVYWEEYRT